MTLIRFSLGLLILANACRASQATVQDAAIGSGSLTTINVSNFDQLRSLIDTRGITSIDTLLASLPASYRSSFTLMAQSRSVQDASWTNPRAIVFGDDASLVMTFNGTPSQKGYNDLELMQFNQASRAFEFYRITFPEGPGAVTYTAKNPAVCIACHQASPRPNWEPYAAWPGAFGNEHDGVAVGLPDQQYVQTFVKTFSMQPRYRQLQNVAAHYVEGQAINQSELTPGRLLAPYASMPNNALMLLLFKENVQRMGAMLAAQPTFAANKYLIASAISGCLTGADATTLSPSAPVPEYRQLYQLDPHLKQAKQAFAAAGDGIFPDNFGLFGAAGWLKVYNAVYKLGLKINLAEWATSFFGANSTATAGLTLAPFNDGSPGLDVSQYVVAAAISQLDADFAGLDTFLCPTPLAQLDDRQISGQQFCANLTARQQELTSKYGFFDPDGGKMVCKILAQKWLKSLAS